MSEADRLEGTMRDLFGRVVYTHKAHEKARERASGRQQVLRWINVVLICLTTVFAILSVVTSERAALVITIVGALLSTLAAGYQLAFDPTDAIATHRMAAKLLLGCREDLVGLIERAQAESQDLATLRTERDELLARVKLIYSLAPDTSAKDYEDARDALKAKGEATFEDDEIDECLPAELRRGGKRPTD